MLLLTGAQDAIRFFYYTFLITPLLLVIILNNGDVNTYCEAEKATEENEV